MVYISFNLKTDSINLSNTESIEKLYNSVYKPLIKLINQNPTLKFSLSINGNLISYFKRKRKEYISLLRKLVDTKQIEILGGGYYDPILPLLLTVDRNGQIDKLTSEIRQSIGIRPRGISLFADSWDSSLVNTLQICGIEYTLLDKNIIPLDKRQFLPIIMNNLGKSIEIFPTYENFIPNKDTTPEEFISDILKNVRKLTKKSGYIQFEPDRIITIEFNSQNLAELLEAKWFEKLIPYIQEHPEEGVEITTITAYRKNNQIKVPAHISSGIINSMIENYTRTSSIYDYLDSYPLAKNLYNRISYVGMLINQYKKDKMRKNNAREKLWLAQSGLALVCSQNGNFVPTTYRQNAYKNLMEAEKIIQNDEGLKESVSCFDYNGDGLNEYVCRMKNYFAVINCVGGAIQELDLVKTSGNYADNLSRKEDFDGYTDNYERGLFIDHLFDENQIKKYLDGVPAGDGIFSKIIYSEVKFSQSHREIQFVASAVIPKTHQKVTLRKKYIINSEGMNIQYIIKNESDKPLDTYFAIENNIANTDFDIENLYYYKLELLSDQVITEIDTSKNSNIQSIDEKLKNIDMIRLTDQKSGISFGFEPNENSNYCFYPLFFQRPDAQGNNHPVHLSFVNTLYWKLNLEPKMETERTINFSMASVKKLKK